jgi:hypothetical protein
MTEGENARAVELMAPFLTRSQVNELCSGRLYEEYRRRKMQIFRWRWARAVWRQRQIAKELQGRETRFVDGLGQHKAVIDPEYQKMLEFVNSESWRDPDFKKAALAQLPELRVPAPAPRFHQVNGFRK